MEIIITAGVMTIIPTTITTITTTIGGNPTSSQPE